MRNRQFRLLDASLCIEFLPDTYGTFWPHEVVLRGVYGRRTHATARSLGAWPQLRNPSLSINYDRSHSSAVTGNPLLSGCERRSAHGPVRQWRSRKNKLRKILNRNNELIVHLPDGYFYLGTFSGQGITVLNCDEFRALDLPVSRSLSFHSA